MNEERIDKAAQSMAYYSDEEWAKAREPYKEHWRRRAMDALSVVDDYDYKDTKRFHAAFRAALAVAKENGYAGLGVAVVHKITRAALDAADQHDYE